MEEIANSTRTSGSGCVSGKELSGMSSKRLVPNGKGELKIKVTQNLNRYKKIARERFTSEEGLMYRLPSPIEPESLFGQTKSNTSYSCFRHFDKDRPEKVTMDFAIFALAFKILKRYRKGCRMGQNPSE